MLSFIYKGNNAGKIRWIDIEPLTVMILIGLLAAIVGPRNLAKAFLILPFALSVIGLVFLIISKTSLFRKGIWFSFGPKLMTRGYARLYRLSYILIGIGVFFLLLLAKDLTP
jgi:hypothetical protein